MFTGLIEETGTVTDVVATDRGLRLRIEADHVISSLTVGDSIAIDGVCQTVVAVSSHLFTVEAMAPTLARTTLGELESGRRVNLERSLRLGDRLGGHMVQGHVDGVGTVAKVDRAGEHVLIDVAIPEDVGAVTVLHGSIAICGVSLTVNEIPGAGVIQVALIPHTWEHTNLSELRPRSRVNLEGDMIGKFVIEYMKRRGTAAANGAKGANGV